MTVEQVYSDILDIHNQVLKQELTFSQAEVRLDALAIEGEKLGVLINPKMILTKTAKLAEDLHIGPEDEDSYEEDSSYS